MGVVRSINKGADRLAYLNHQSKTIDSSPLTWLTVADSMARDTTSAPAPTYTPARGMGGAALSKPVAETRKRLA